MKNKVKYRKFTPLSNRQNLLIKETRAAQFPNSDYLKLKIGVDDMSFWSFGRVYVFEGRNPRPSAGGHGSAW